MENNPEDTYTAKAARNTGFRPTVKEPTSLLKEVRKVQQVRNENIDMHAYWYGRLSFTLDV